MNIRVGADLETLDTFSQGLDQWIELLREKPLTTVQIAENFLNHAVPQAPGPEQVMAYGALMLATAMQRLAMPEVGDIPSDWSDPPQ